MISKESLDIEITGLQARVKELTELLARAQGSLDFAQFCAKDTVEENENANQLVE